MIRKNSCVSAGSSPGEGRSRVVTEPMMEVSGARSSWFTMDRNSVRSRSSSSSGARFCRVTTIDSTSPSADRIGVGLTSIATSRPSDSESVISSARTVSALVNCWARDAQALVG